MAFFSFLQQEIAMDLGTANTIIIHNDKIVVDEPSIVAIEEKTGKLVELPINNIMFLVRLFIFVVSTKTKKLIVGANKYTAHIGIRLWS